MEIIDRTDAQTMLYLTCITITSVDLAHYGISRAKDCVSVDCGTNCVLCADVLSSVFITCDFCILTFEFHVLSFPFCFLCYMF